MRRGRGGRRAPPTSSSTWPPAAGPGAAGARWPRWRRPCRTPAACTWSTTAPPRWCWPRPRWPPGREIVVSRGELVEIGDGFRLPDLLASTGARLREVGTTNRTALRRLRRRDRPGHRLRAQGAPVELRGRAGSPRARRRSPSWPALRRAGGRRHRLRAARPAPAAARRAGRGHRAARRRRRWSPPAATSCSAGRRPGCCSAGADAGRAAAPAPAGPGAAGGQAHPGRAGGDPARAGDARPGRRCAADPAALRRRARAAAPARLARHGVDADRGRVGGRGGRRRRARASSCPSRPSRCRRRTPPPLRAGDPAGARPGGARAAACSTCACVPAAADDALQRRGAAAPGRAADVHVVATAGHVDHGKSTLVRALTGMEPDRWAEERRRGMTIDLGFAWTDLPGGETVAFVDVPGHERFVPNMLAGVGPVPAAMLVVAADEGWMPQSRRAPRRAGRARTSGTGCSWSPAATWPTRSRRATRRSAELAGTSLAGVRGGVRSAAHRRRAGRAARRARPAGRRAARAGRRRAPSGCGWTGRSPSGAAARWSPARSAAGRMRVGDELELARRPARPVRGAGPAVARRAGATEVAAVARVAVNLRGVRRDGRRARGRAAHPGPRGWPPTMLDVRLHRRRRPVGRLPRELVLHVGSAAVPVRVRPLGGDTARLHPARRRCRCGSATAACCAIPDGAGSPPG